MTYSVNKDMSYLQQKPWIFNGTLRENILMGSQFD